MSSDRDAVTLLAAINALDRLIAWFTYLNLTPEARALLQQMLTAIRAALYARRVEHGLPPKPAKRAA